MKKPIKAEDTAARLQRKHNARMRNRKRRGKCAVSFYDKTHKASLKRMNNILLREEEF